MKKALITCVNFNTYSVLNDYIRSIDVAAKKVVDKLSVTIAVADNTDQNYKDISIETETAALNIFSYHKNLGYMGGAVQILKDMQYEQVSAYDYVFVSNVDITLSEDFFEKLLEVETRDVGWIVPSVFRKSDGTNENPFIVNMPSKFKMNLYITMYRFPVLYNFYQKISERNRSKDNCPQMSVLGRDIYAGMGSIFIFTQAFIKKNYPLSFPTFMYGEEIYYGYLVKSMGMRTVFSPTVRAYDIGGVSTGQLKSAKKCDMNKKSLIIIRDLMY